ncbi:bifunctional UDP-sugar hydrolase/5'-nucleotidase [Frigoribacterium sp. VKM Ac-2836]|uniref:bifunctional metallophosphatase/5'-nucleotidase n=1 Tax=Frigoribacterium sp. VKM Ac-2836 TaxID=2739014 RepID=UPI00156586E1|nr:bifunctional UDP-sugar hydrolase/5'-nucleotidase [Frigoribacterium sp. VKM Ac-2836]NRD27312.1 bifunctional metallophosphatase/5'-nucleotidase [Frigoribacterium sp. VKM Ac-2836]
MRISPPSSESVPTGGRRRVRGAALASVAAGTLLLGLVAAAPAQAVPVTIDLVGINDFHGRLEADAPGSRASIAGAAVLAGAVKSVEAENANTLFVSAGDNIGASTFTSFIQNDEPTLDALNAMGLDVSTPGNHEFDQGQADFTGRVRANSDFPYVNANILRDGAPVYDPYVVEEIGGVRVAFIGALTETMPTLVSPAGIEGLTFAPVVDSVNAVADDIVANDAADAIVLLLHEGAETGSLDSVTGDNAFGEIARGVSGDVSAIFSGHTHQGYDYLVSPSDGGPQRAVVQTGSYGTNLARVTMTVDPAATDFRDRVTIASHRLVPLYNAFTPDPTVQAIVAEAVDVAADRGAEVIGSISDSFNRAYNANPDANGLPVSNRAGESTLGNFVADIQLASTTASGAQLAFMNPGGLRDDLPFVAPNGDVTYKAAAAVQPFANTLVVVDMTGAEIRQVLEQQWPTAARNSTLKLGTSEGLSYTYDPAASAGSRIASVSLDGAALDDATVYKVTVNSFLASGGDGFAAFANGRAHADSGKVDLQSQLEYFDTQAGDPSDPDFASRSVGVSELTAAPVGGFAAGDTVSMTLSSLVLQQAAADASGTVTATLDGVELASAPIDETILDNSDEQGRATLSFVVPEGITAPVAGPVTRSIVLTVDGTGTTASVPIVFAAAAAPVVVPPTDPGNTPPVTAPGGTVPGGTVPGATPGSGTGSTPAGTVRNPDGSLAFTGQDGLGLAALAALALMLAGGSALVLARRRRLRATATSPEA